jgi:hypothetical protein
VDLLISFDHFCPREPDARAGGAGAGLCPWRLTAALGLGEDDVADAVRWARAAGTAPVAAESPAAYRAPKARAKPAAPTKKPARRA